MYLKKNLKAYRLLKIEAEKLRAFDLKTGRIAERVSKLYIKLKKVEGRNLELTKKIKDELIILEKVLNKLDDEYDIINGKFKSSKENNKILEFTGAFHELFADLLAVLYFEDPTIMYKSQLISNSSPKTERIAKMRDFTQEVLAKDWSVTQEHGLFAPVRYHIWKNYWPSIMTVESKRMLLEKLLKAMLPVIEKQLAQDELDKPEDMDRKERRNIQQQLVLDLYREVRPFSKDQEALFPLLTVYRDIQFDAWFSARWKEPGFAKCYEDDDITDPEWWKSNIRYLEEILSL